MGWSDRWIFGGMMVLLAACAPVSNPVPIPDMNVTQSLHTEKTKTVQIIKTPTGGASQGTAAQTVDDRKTVYRQGTVVTMETVRQIPILMYHSISDNPNNLLCLSPAKFKEQMQYLKQAGYHPITTRDLEVWQAGNALLKKPVLITLDDGYRDNYTDAFPVLKELGLKATIYVTTGFLGAKLNLTRDMAKEMQQSGLIEFGSHSLSHADLTTLTTDRLHAEIFASKAELEKELGVPITSFCYPSGRFNQHTVQLVKEAGYTSAVTTKPGMAEIAQGMLTLHRHRINGDMTIQQFKNLLP